MGFFFFFWKRKWRESGSGERGSVWQGESRRDGGRGKLAGKCCMREESDNGGKKENRVEEQSTVSAKFPISLLGTRNQITFLM